MTRPGASTGAALALLLAATGAAAQSAPEDSPDETTDDLAGKPTPDETVDGTVEPADCTTYGSGYLTLPGTSTCLRIGGYVRFDSGFADLNGLDTDDPPDGDADTWDQASRFALNTYTSSETRFGRLDTFTEVRFNYANTIDATATGAVSDLERTSSSSTSLNFAWIELGGLRLGKGESLFSTFAGYGGAVINDTEIGGYGPFDTQFAQYTHEGDGFTAAVGIENGTGAEIVDDYVPHVVLGLGAETAAGVALRGALALDTRDEDDLGGVSAKLRGDYGLSEGTSVFLMALYGENAGGFTTWATGDASDDTVSLMGGHTATFGDRLATNSQLQWVQGNGGDDAPLNVVVNLAWEVVRGVSVTPELQWASDVAGDDGVGGVIRVQGSF